MNIAEHLSFNVSMGRGGTRENVNESGARNLLMVNAKGKKKKEIRREKKNVVE